MKCKLCETELTFKNNCFSIKNAPAGAQHFSSTEKSAKESTITLVVVSCETCGLVQSASPPVAYFKKAITAAGISPAMRAHRLQQAKQIALLSNIKPGAKIALIGCGNGYELPILEEAGFSPVGVEFGGHFETINNHYRIIDHYPSKDNKIDGLSFEAFACFNFLEHSPNPKDFLLGIRSLLCAKSIGIIEVPNYAKQRTDHRVTDYIADHLSYFDVRTLSAMLILAGFDILQIEHTRNGENIYAIVQPIATSALSLENSYLYSIRSKVSRFFEHWRRLNKTALVWGASHQALTLLSGLDDNLRPNAIIDSAVFKQGQFAPAVGIPILPPSKNLVKNTDVILIVASGYEAEISTTLRSKYSFEGEIWRVSSSEIEPVAGQ